MIYTLIVVVTSPRAHRTPSLVRIKPRFFFYARFGVKKKKKIPLSLIARTNLRRRANNNNITEEIASINSVRQVFSFCEYSKGYYDYFSFGTGQGDP